jgi:flagellar biosynthesis/type III secretory pathway protein FliH
MKKILILGFVALALVFTSCKKENPEKDVQNSINKLTYFNNSFNEFNADGVITVEGEDNEFGQLKKIASDYYEAINKINTKVTEDRDKVAEGKKSTGYEEAYKAAIKELDAEISKATTEFTANMEKLAAVKK